MGVVLFWIINHQLITQLSKAGWFKMIAMIILFTFYNGHFFGYSDAIKLYIWKLRCQSMYAPD